MCSICWLHSRNYMNTQVHDGPKIDAVVPIYNLIEYSDAYSKTSLNVNGEITDCPANDSNSALF